MPQLHFYVSDETAQRIKHKAQAAGMSTSQYIAELVKNELTAVWPQGFFEEVVGGWQGEPLQRASQGDYETRAFLFEEQP